MGSRVRTAVVFAALLSLAATGTASSRSPLPLFAGCSGGSNPHLRPTEILVACGDGGFGFQGIHWESWTALRAVGHATAYQNLCTPYCAAGHFVHFRVSLMLSRPRLCTNHQREFTVIKWHPTTSSPPSVATSGSRKSPFLSIGPHPVTCP
jgi:hypothetical protein